MNIQNVSTTTTVTTGLKSKTTGKIIEGVVLLIFLGEVVWKVIKIANYGKFVSDGTAFSDTWSLIWYMIAFFFTLYLFLSKRAQYQQSITLDKQSRELTSSNGLKIKFETIQDVTTLLKERSWLRPETQVVRLTMANGQASLPLAGLNFNQADEVVNLIKQTIA